MKGLSNNRYERIRQIKYLINGETGYLQLHKLLLVIFNLYKANTMRVKSKTDILGKINNTI